MPGLDQLSSHGTVLSMSASLRQHFHIEISIKGAHKKVKKLVISGYVNYETNGRSRAGSSSETSQLFWNKSLFWVRVFRKE
jgi:hypothetical protein